MRDAHRERPAGRSVRGRGHLEPANDGAGRSGGRWGLVRAAPDQRPAGERGRGLLVVARLTDRTGVRGDQRGRLVWVELPWEDTRVSDTASSAQPRTWFCGFLATGCPGRQAVGRPDAG
jgi:hypothetical protein